MKKLFLSFTTTLSGIAAGTISDNDLRTGLFYFGCVRDDAFNQNLTLNAGGKTWAGSTPEAHAKLVEALHLAEREQRAGWSRPAISVRSTDDFISLGAILLRHNLPFLGQMGGRFTFQGVAESIAALRAPLQAVY
jgi:hypothetical protein